MKTKIYHLLKSEQQNRGFTLVETLAVLSIIGIFAAIAGPVKSWAENPLGNATNQTVGVLNLIRMRAISTTSAYRIKPDPTAPGNKYIVQIAQTRGCESSTELTADAASTDQELTVASTEGLVVGDSIAVGTDKNNNEIIATSALTITLGEELGTTQTENATIELMNNWFNDLNFTKENLTLPEKIAMSGNLSNWALCFDSRGQANLYNGSGVVEDEDLTLTLTNTSDEETSEITVFRGGAIEVNNPE
ncbi:pilus assembly FimT family protein [Crocosphaera sp. Alani8]|uniref:pilus assembly FimT family protein n=1 Tax=Crocosphaera sp. Alani8 TaxID=3038952 RepID=UPI00313ADDD5